MPKDALAAANEAVATFRQITAIRRDYRPNLALALVSQANALGNLGQWRESGKAATKAVGYYRRSGVASLDEYRLQRSRALIVLETAPRERREWKKGMAAVEERIRLVIPLLDEIPRTMMMRPTYSTSIWRWLPKPSDDQTMR